MRGNTESGNSTIPERHEADGWLTIVYPETIDSVNNVPIRYLIKNCHVLAKQADIPIEAVRLPDSGFPYIYGSPNDPNNGWQRYHTYQQEKSKGEAIDTERLVYGSIRKEIWQPKEQISFYGPGDGKRVGDFLMGIYEIEGGEEMSLLRTVREFHQLVREYGLNSIETFLNYESQQEQYGENWHVPDGLSEFVEKREELNLHDLTFRTYLQYCENLYTYLQSPKMRIFDVSINLYDIGADAVDESHRYLTEVLGLKTANVTKIMGNFLEGSVQANNTSDSNVGHVCLGKTPGNIDVTLLTDRIETHLRPDYLYTRSDLFMVLGKDQSVEKLDEEYPYSESHDAFVKGPVAAIFGYEFEHLFEAVHHSHNGSSVVGSVTTTRALGGFQMTTEAMKKYPKGIKVQYFERKSKQYKEFTFLPGQCYYTIGSWRAGENLKYKLAQSCGSQQGMVDTITEHTKDDIIGYEMRLKPKEQVSWKPDRVVRRLGIRVGNTFFGKTYVGYDFLGRVLKNISWFKSKYPTKPRLAELMGSVTLVTVLIVLYGFMLGTYKAIESFSRRAEKERLELIQQHRSLLLKMLTDEQDSNHIDNMRRIQQSFLAGVQEMDEFSVLMDSIFDPQTYQESLIQILNIHYDVDSLRNIGQDVGIDFVNILSHLIISEIANNIQDGDLEQRFNEYVVNNTGVLDTLSELRLTDVSSEEQMHQLIEELVTGSNEHMSVLQVMKTTYGIDLRGFQRHLHGGTKGKKIGSGSSKNIGHNFSGREKGAGSFSPGKQKPLFTGKKGRSYKVPHRIRNQI